MRVIRNSIGPAPLDQGKPGSPKQKAKLPGFAWLLLVVLLGCFALQSYHLGDDSIWWDEALSVYRATHDVPFILSNQIVIDNVVTHDQHPPLYFLLLHYWIQLAGKSEFALRFPSIMAGLLLVPLVYVLARRVVGAESGVDEEDPSLGEREEYPLPSSFTRLVSLLAASLIAFSPFVLWQAREARMYTLITLEGALAVYATLRLAAKTPFEPAGEAAKPRWFWLAVWMLANGAMVFTHYSGVMLLLFEISIWFSFPVRRLQRPWIWVPVGILLVGLLLLPSIAVAAGWPLPSGLPIDTNSIPSLQTAGASAVQGFPFLIRETIAALNLGISVDAFRFAWAGIILTLVALLGTLGIVRFEFLPHPSRSAQEEGAGFDAGHRGLPSRFLHGPLFRKSWLTVGYVLVPLVGLYLLANLFSVQFYTRYLLISTPGYYIALAAGVVTASRILLWWRSPHEGLTVSPVLPRQMAFRMVLFFVVPVVVLLAGVGVAWGYVTYNYFVAPEFRRDDNRSWGEILRHEGEPGDLVILDSPELFVLNDYYGNPQLPFLGLPRYPTFADERTTAELAQVTPAYRRIWLVQAHTWRDPDKLVQSWLDQNNFKLVDMGVAGFTSATKFSLYLQQNPIQPALPAMLSPVPLPAHLANGLEFVAAEISPAKFTNPDAPVEAGENIAVRLGWYRPVTATASLEDANFALKLVDSNGLEWNRISGPPFNDKLPVSHWPVGKYVIQDLHLLIPPGIPAGKYYLVLNTYNPVSQAPVSILDQQGNPQGTNLSIGTIDVIRPIGIAFPTNTPALETLAAGLDLIEAQKDRDTIRPGEAVQARFSLRATQPTKVDAEIQIQLVDSQGKVQLWQSTYLGGEGSSPMSWRQGEVRSGQVGLLIPSDIAVDPHETYHIRLAFYDRHTKMPLSSWPSWWPGEAKGTYNTGKLQIQEPDRRFQLPPGASIPVHSGVPEVSAGGLMSLLGYDFPQRLTAGQLFPVELYWRATTPLSVSYKISVQLLDANGRLVTQHDGIPGDWGRPTMGWLPGEIIADSHPLDIPVALPPGSYSIIVAVYQEATGERLAVHQMDGQPADVISLATIDYNSQMPK